MDATEPAVDDNLHRDRLAELVLHLVGCTPERAVVAIDQVLDSRQPDADDALEVVARAIVALRRPIDLRDRNGSEVSDVDLRPEHHHVQSAKVGGRRSDQGSAASS